MCGVVGFEGKKGLINVRDRIDDKPPPKIYNSNQIQNYYNYYIILLL
jgi:hypothetical protein